VAADFFDSAAHEQYAHDVKANAYEKSGGGCACDGIELGAKLVRAVKHAAAHYQEQHPPCKSENCLSIFRCHCKTGFIFLPVLLSPYIAAKPMSSFQGKGFVSKKRWVRPVLTGFYNSVHLLF